MYTVHVYMVYSIPRVVSSCLVISRTGCTLYMCTWCTIYLEW